MTITVMPRVSPLWLRLGFIHTTATLGEPESYIGHIKVKDHHIKLAIDININGTTATWLHDPPKKLKKNKCIFKRSSKSGSHGWWAVHYQKESPATFEEAFSSFCHHAENLL